MTRRQAQPEEPRAESSVRERIVAGARRHFLAHGFRGVTMDDLAAELAMSKKTLYAHFRSKPELVQAVIVAKAAEIEAELGRIETERGSDFSGALHDMLSCLQQHAAEVQPTFVRDMQQTAPDLFKTVETRRAALIQRYFGKLFEDGRRAGMVRKDLPPQLAIAILLAAIQGVVNPQKIGELGVTPQAALSAIVSAVLLGILTPDGRKNQ